jgi:hypothetical protein
VAPVVTARVATAVARMVTRRRVPPLVDSLPSSPRILVVASAVAAAPPLRLRRTMVVGSAVHGRGLIGSADLRRLLGLMA